MDIPQEEHIQDDFLSFLASKTDSECEKLYTFAVDSLTFATKIQIWHWTCESGFHHTQFEELYKIVRDFADKLVETVLSMGYKFKIDSKNYLISDDVFELSNALIKIQNFRDELEKLKKQYGTKISLDNIFADTIEAIDKEIGLLKNFK